MVSVTRFWNFQPELIRRLVQRHIHVDLLNFATAEINVADAHPSGKRPFGREQYIEKFRTLTDEIISRKESERFLMLVQNLKKLKSNDLKSLNIEVIKKFKNKQSKKLTIF